MPRYFTLSQAERLLPEVEPLLREALTHKAAGAAAEKELTETLYRIRMAGGSRVSPGPILAMRARRDIAGAGLQNAMERIEQIGVQVKDLDIGLIDFLTRYHGREVCLCWKLGEDRIRFWHSTEEGFRGRKAIDNEFLQNHKGEPTN